MKDIEAFIETRFTENIRAQFRLKRSPGEFADFPTNLNPKLKDVLHQQGIHQLYSHQHQAFESISGDQDTLLVSHTASGKTLSFFLPVLDAYVKSETPFSVLLLYPTKALSRDQEGAFGSLMKAVDKDDRLGTFDGDTPREERSRIQRSSDFIITNPDMLHSGILPNHNRKWKDFLSRLRYIIIDEVHIYRGAFGSHVSNVFRRLLRICEIHGSRPVFICSSATIGNPDEHAAALFNRAFKKIAKDGAPKAEKEIYFINPPLIQSHGHAVYRKGPAAISVPLIREAAKNNVRTICFCRARQEVERLYRAVTDGHPELKTTVKPYRGGLLPNERRQLEKDLVAGKIVAIITTNALELGIDIGDLELCILSGFPGSNASFWQQSGRVGRKEKSSTTVLVAKDNPIDQYLVHHPEFLTSAPIEQALLDAENPYILLQHLPCMALEHPLREREEQMEPQIFQEAVDILKADGTIVPFRENLRYALQDYPAKGVNLRGMTDHNINIYCGSEVIGELDPIGARGTLYKDAIYQHLGRRYLSLELDLEKKLCRVEPVNVDYYTEAHWEGRVEMTESDELKQIRDARLEFGSIHYNKQPKLYKKIRERTYENIGFGPITLPPFEYDTTGFSLMPPKPWVDAMELKDKRLIGAALYGLSYILRHSAPAFCMADINDIETDVALVEVESQQWKSALYLFDTIEGGVGYAERIFELLETCLEMCFTILNECECAVGCPACVPPLPPGVSNENLESFLVESNGSVECTKSLLNALLKGNIVTPQITTFEIPAATPIEAAAINFEDQKRERKLNRAAMSLKKKRERVH